MPSPPPLTRSASESDAAEITARILLETESVLFRPDDPFTFTSGCVRRSISTAAG